MQITDRGRTHVGRRVKAGDAFKVVLGRDPELRRGAHRMFAVITQRRT